MKFVKEKLHRIFIQIIFFIFKKRGKKKKTLLFFLSGNSLNSIKLNSSLINKSYNITINNYFEILKKVKSTHQNIILHDLIIFSPTEFLKRKKDIMNFLKRKDTKYFLTLKKNLYYLSRKEKNLFNTYKKKIIFCDHNNLEIVKYAKKLKIKNLGNLNTLFYSLLFYVKRYNNILIYLIGCDGSKSKNINNKVYFSKNYTYQNRINNIFHDMICFDFYWPIFQFKFLRERNYSIFNLNKNSYYKSIKKIIN